MPDPRLILRVEGDGARATRVVVLDRVTGNIVGDLARVGEVTVHVVPTTRAPSATLRITEVEVALDGGPPRG